MKFFIALVVLVWSFTLLAEDRYKMVASDADSPYMWILDTKTGDVFSCLGARDCVLISNIKDVKAKSR